MWVDDHLWLAANWGYCFMDGKHPLTTEEEWKILEEFMKGEVIYTEKRSKKLFHILCEKRFELYMKLTFL